MALSDRTKQFLFCALSDKQAADELGTALGTPVAITDAAQTFSGQKTFEDLVAPKLAAIDFSLVDSSASASPIGGVRLRNHNGTLQVSANGDIYRGIDLPIRPEDYGAVGNGTTDDYIALQAAIVAATAAGKPLKLSAKIYATSQELVTTTTNHFVMVGEPMVNGVGAAIRAIAPMRAILLSKLVVAIRDVVFDGNYGLAHTGLYLHQTSLAKFDDIGCQGQLWDGVFVAGEQDSTHHCSSTIDLPTLRFLRAGPMVVKAADRNPLSGTCSVSSGNDTVTFTNAPDLTTLPGLVGNRIIVKNGTSSVFYGAVQSVTSNTVTLNPASGLPIFTASGCEWVMCGGHGAISDTNSFYNFSGGGIGTLWASANVLTQYSSISGISRNGIANTTASVTSGGSTVTLVGGGMDLWTAGIREGDLCFIGDGAQRRMVMVVLCPTPTTFMVDTTFDYTATGLSWAIGHGAAYHEARNADANITSFAGTSLIRGCAGGGLEFAGFYGPKIDGFQIDYCGMAAIRIGLSVCIGAVLTRTYCESSGPQTGGVNNGAWTKAIYLSSVQGVIINMPLNGGNNLAENVQYSPQSSTGIYTGRYGQEPIGSYTSTVPVNTLFSPTVTGTISLGTSSIALGHPHTTTLALPGNIVNLDPGIADVTVTAAPLFSGPPGLYVLRNHLTASNTITFNGATAPGVGGAAPQAFFQGSNVFFAAPCTLTPGDAVVLYSDGTYFFEVCRSIRKDPISTYSSTAPTTGTHQIGEKVWNSSPTSGGNVGWVCTATGTPGTWLPFGTIG